MYIQTGNKPKEASAPASACAVALGDKTQEAHVE